MIPNKPTDGWQSLISAPRNGRPILLCSNQGTMVIGHYINGRWYYAGGSWDESAFEIRWQPLPDKWNSKK